MKATDRQRVIKEIATELKHIAKRPVRSITEDDVHDLITARNFLRAITSRHIQEEPDA